MANQFTEVSTKGFGQRILGSIIGIPIGLVLIAVGIGVLFWNEGRFDFSKLAKNAIEVQASQPAPPEAQGKLVALKGTVVTQEKIGDVFLNPGDYLALKRTSEMYSWVEKANNQTQSNSGGSETTTTTYDYTKQWAENVMDSGNFKNSEGHINPAKTIESTTIRVNQVKVGNYTLDFGVLDLPPFTSIPLDANNTVLASGFALTADNKLYNGATYAEPQIGETRISYGAVGNNFSGTVLGKLNGQNVESFADSKNHRLYRLFEGSKQDAVTTLHSEYKKLLWLYRLGGFLAIFFGLTMLLGPITTLMSFFPTLGKIGNAVVMTIAFPVALLLSGVTILVGIVAHSPIVLAITLLATTIASVYYIRKRGQKVAQA